MALLALAAILARLKQLATSLLKLFSLPSRWKYVTLQAHAALVLYGCEAISPLLLAGLSTAWGLPFETSGDYAVSDVFAQSTLLLMLPFSIIYFLISLHAIRVTVREGNVPWYEALAASDAIETSGGTGSVVFRSLMHTAAGIRRTLGGISKSQRAIDDDSQLQLVHSEPKAQPINAAISAAPTPLGNEAPYAAPVYI